MVTRSVRKINGERPVVATYDALTFLALLALQVPPPGTHFTRYYGYYSTCSRAKRRQACQTEQADAVTNGKSAPVQIEPPSAKARRRHWAELLRLVYEVDPMQWSQSDVGSWSADSPPWDVLYTGMLAGAIGRFSEDANDHKAVEKARTWLLANQRADGSWPLGTTEDAGDAFATAVVLDTLTLMEAPPKQTVDLARAWLVDSLPDSGEWESKAADSVEATVVVLEQAVRPLEPRTKGSYLRAAIEFLNRSERLIAQGTFGARQLAIMA